MHCTCTSTHAHTHTHTHTHAHTHTHTHAHTHTHTHSWIDSYMDELPASESPNSSQPEPEPEPVAENEQPEPYIMFEKPKSIVPSPSHQPIDNRYPPASCNQVTEGDDAAKSDSYYSDRYSNLMNRGTYVGKNCLRNIHTYTHSFVGVTPSSVANGGSQCCYQLGFVYQYYCCNTREFSACILY